MLFFVLSTFFLRRPVYSVQLLWNTAAVESVWLFCARLPCLSLILIFCSPVSFDEKSWWGLKLSVHSACGACLRARGFEKAHERKLRYYVIVGLIAWLVASTVVFRFFHFASFRDFYCKGAVFLTASDPVSVISASRGLHFHTTLVACYIFLVEKTVSLTGLCFFFRLRFLDWLIDWLMDCLMFRLIDWLIGRSIIGAAIKIPAFGTLHLVLAAKPSMFMPSRIPDLMQVLH